MAVQQIKGRRAVSRHLLIKRVRCGESGCISLFCAFFFGGINVFQYFCNENVYIVIMATVKKVGIDELVQDDKNFNKGTKRGEELMRRSLQKFGAGRSVLIDKNDRLIAGNKTQETAMREGIKDVLVVETDGKTLVAVKRTDIDLDSEEGRELALADNVTASVNIDLEYAKMKDELSKEVLKSWEIKEPLKTQTEMLSKLEYNSCYYEPKEKPQIRLEDCVDMSKFEAKIEALKEYDLTDEEREVLRLFAYRFIRIDFESVANYYAFNASEEMKKAIERLRLVLVDNGIDGYVEDGMLRIVNVEEPGND